MSSNMAEHRSSQNTHPGFMVPPPFDTSSSGDCYLQSTDGTLFKVLRHVLTGNSESPFFANLLSEIPSSSLDGLPIFRVDEDAQTLYHVLVFLSSVLVDVLDPRHIIKIADVQEKYGIPETRLALPVTNAIHTIRLRRITEADGAVELFGLAWKHQARLPCQVISRYTHTADLSDLSVANAIVRCAKSIDAYVSLADLRRQRDLALDGIIEALEPRTHLCPFHSASDQMFFSVMNMLKAAARNALAAPYPICSDAFLFLGLKGPDALQPVIWCTSCYTTADGIGITQRLRDAVERYPQEITIMPDDIWPSA